MIAGPSDHFNHGLEVVDATTIFSDALSLCKVERGSRHWSSLLPLFIFGDAEPSILLATCSCVDASLLCLCVSFLEGILGRSRLGSSRHTQWAVFAASHTHK